MTYSDSEGRVTADEAAARRSEVARRVDLYRAAIEAEADSTFEVVTLPNGTVLLDFAEDGYVVARLSSLDADAGLILDGDVVDAAEECLGCGDVDYWPVCPSCRPPEAA